MNKRMDHCVSFSFTHASLLHLKAKFIKKNWSHTLVSTWPKQAPIIYESFGLLLRNKHFQTPLEQANKLMSRFLLLRPSFTKKEMFKKFVELFQQYANIHSMYSMLYTVNLGLCDYALFSQIRSQFKNEVGINKKYWNKKDGITAIAQWESPPIGIHVINC